MVENIITFIGIVIMLVIVFGSKRDWRTYKNDRSFLGTKDE